MEIFVAEYGVVLQKM